MCECWALMFRTCRCCSLRCGNTATMLGNFRGLNFPESAHASFPLLPTFPCLPRASRFSNRNSLSPRVLFCSVHQNSVWPSSSKLFFGLWWRTCSSVPTWLRSVFFRNFFCDLCIAMLSFLLFSWVFLLRCCLMGGTQWRSWSRHCATNRKVAGSIPNGVTNFSVT